MSCGGCSTDYPFRPAGALDLRLQRPKEVSLTFSIGGPPLTSDHPAFSASEPIPPPIPPAGPGALALDLGCGTGLHRPLLEKAGYEFVGIDYFNEEAPIMADAHALPFADNSFDLIFTAAVLEHIRYPFVMMAEAFRVLKPGARIQGTVAFQEPFHMDSHYHHSHLGTLNTLLQAGFEVDAVLPDRNWRALKAQASMVLFPKMPMFLRPLPVLPLDLMHRLWWRIAGLLDERGSEEVRLRSTAGAFTFIARKPS